MKRLLLLVVAVAAAATVAGVYLPSDAATGEYGTVPRQALDDDLRAIGRSADYACFLSAQRHVAGLSAAPLRGAGTTGSTITAFGTAFTDDWLESMVTDQVVGAEVARDGLTVTRADLLVGRQVLARRMTEVLREYQADNAQASGCGGDGSAVLASLPGWFVAQQVRAEAGQAVLDARAAGAGLGHRALESYYAAHRARFDRYCASYIVVTTKARALAAQAAVSGGTPFAQEAQAVSITGQTGAKGGVAGCAILLGTVFAGKLTTTPVGGTSVFSGQGVWWLVMVTKRSTQSFSAVRKYVITAVLTAGQLRADAQLSAALRSATLKVDPRYGAAVPGKVTPIRPPVVPPVRSLLSVSADVPTAASH